MRARCDLSSANMFSRFTRSFQENQPLDSVAAEIVEVERYSSGTDNARFATLCRLCWPTSGTPNPNQELTITQRAG